MKVKCYNSLEEAGNAIGEDRIIDEIELIYSECGWVCADVISSTPNVYLSLHRLFKALRKYPEFDRWKMPMFRGIYQGIFADSDIKKSDGEINTNPSYSWAIKRNSHNVAITIFFQV